MQIMEDAYTHMRVLGESDQIFKDKFVSERTRQFDILRDKEEFSNKLDSSKKRVEKFLTEGYVLKSSDGRQLDHGIREVRELANTVSDKYQGMVSCDAALFASNGITLKEGKGFEHNFNSKIIEDMREKKSAICKILETLEMLSSKHQKLFKGLNFKGINKKRRRKENDRKSKNRKNMRFNKNVEKVFNICVVSPFPSMITIPSPYKYPPSAPIPESHIDVEGVASHTSIFRYAKHIASLVNDGIFSNAASSRLLANLPDHVSEQVWRYLYPEEHSSTSDNDVDSSEEDDEDISSTDDDEVV